MPKIYFEEKGPSLLKLRGMTKTEFAGRMGIRKQNVNILFKSKNLTTIRRAAEVLNVPFELLVGYVTEPWPEDLAHPEPDAILSSVAHQLVEAVRDLSGRGSLSPDRPVTIRDCGYTVTVKRDD